jgi:hypothetical protein
MVRPVVVWLALAIAALGASGCGRDTPELPSACTRGESEIARALERAPGRAALGDGTRLSTCLNRARSDAELQTVGLLWTRVADGLARDVGRSDVAALRLGYLVGAARRGARTTSGIHEELVRRLEQAAGLDGAPPAHRAAYRRGLAAGSAGG